MNGIKTIIAKELHRVFFDKKMIISLFVLPAVLVIGLYFLTGRLMTGLMSDVEEHIPTVIVKNAPEQVKTLIQASEYDKKTYLTYVDGEETTAEEETGIQDGSVELLVIFSPQFMEQARNYQKAGDTLPQVLLCYNTTGNYSTVAKDMFTQTILYPLEQQMLLERFGNLELLSVFATDTKIIVNEDKANGEFIAMLLPYFITFLLFAGAMSLGVDAIAGEKERGTMASMLLSPVKRSEIVVGKLISLGILSGLSAIVYAASMIAAMPLMTDMFGPGEEIPINVSFHPLQVIELLATMMVMVYLYVSIIAAVSVVAKSVKEATTYVTPIYIIVLAGGLVTMFRGGAEKALASFAVPVYGNAIAIQNLLTNELTTEQFLLSLCGTLLLGILCTVFLTRAFNSEKIMFNA